jgi:hypothetical protein
LLGLLIRKSSVLAKHTCQRRRFSKISLEAQRDKEGNGCCLESGAVFFYISFYPEKNVLDLIIDSARLIQAPMLLLYSARTVTINFTQWHRVFN